MKLSASLFTGLLISSSLVGQASAMTAHQFDRLIVDGQTYDLSARFLAGQFDEKIRRNYTSIDGWHDADGEARNRKALKKHAECRFTPGNCKSPSAR